MQDSSKAKKQKKKRMITLDDEVVLQVFTENHISNKERGQNKQINTTQEMEELIKDGLLRRQEQRK